MDVVMAAAVDAAQSIPGLKDIDPSRLQRLVREIAPKLIASLPGPRNPPTSGATPGPATPQKE
ncbi:hypothetical protein [Kocuria rosea]|uniref:hypothetical protein n=1 Tax=Kocuria rosea TaxID=1275 RepID=UPI003D32E6D9